MKSKGPGIQKLINDCSTLTATKDAKELALEEMIEFMNKFSYDPPLDKIIVYTGIEGKLNFHEEIARQYGIPWTAEDREEHRQELINSGQTIFKI